jgi:hypothetical protein
MTKHSVSSLLVITALWLSACSNPATSSSPNRQASDDVVVTGQASGAPDGCGVEEVAQRLLDFADAFNRNDLQVVPTFFSNRAPFAWYSAPDGNPTAGAQGTAVYSTKDLPAYFERRHAQHEQLFFKEIQVNGWETQRGLVHFEFTVNRRADDLNGGIARDVIGKGALHCQTQTFVVISIGSA